ncbi:SPASM domain-containing protein [Dehalobacter sp. DCM]|uniref:radical SAM protein n=1 Tax=Dehalobacter sp. DCM TaxID=2907827 RepID=UPI0030813ED4|nr:SPASM domain-containing protein [Dehalobacter sp. DCM]
MRKFKDRTYGFETQFDADTGLYIRSNVLNENGEDTGEEPFMAEMPHLLDIGIMGHCDHGGSGLCVQSGVQCYQDGWHKHEPNMSLLDYKAIIRQCEGHVCQIALGGRGDPDMHDDFEAILVSTREAGVVPNMTTSGLGLTSVKARLIAEYCGAAAVSWYRSEYTLKAIAALLDEGVHTNIHYVLSNQSLDEAIALIEQKRIPKGIGRIIFLLHKPVGLGRQDNVLDILNPKVRYFFGLFNDAENCRIAGFDSCCVPGLLNMAWKVHPASIEPCEGGRFSAYVTPDMQMLPCSFDQQQRWKVDLRRHTLLEAWNSKEFDEFRKIMRNSCPDCSLKGYCLGGCPVVPEIVLCGMIRGGKKIENTN